MEAAATVWIDRWLDRAKDRLRRALRFPAEWQEASIASERVLYLTAAEAVQLANDTHALWDPYRDRNVNPVLRPPGSLRFEVLAFGYPVDEPPGSDGD